MFNYVKTLPQIHIPSDTILELEKSQSKSVSKNRLKNSYKYLKRFVQKLPTYRPMWNHYALKKSYNPRVAFAINSPPRKPVETTKEQMTLSLAFRKDKIAALFFTTQSEVFAQGQAFPSAFDEFVVITNGTTKAGAPRAPVFVSQEKGERAEWGCCLCDSFLSLKCLSFLKRKAISRKGKEYSPKIFMIHHTLAKVVSQHATLALRWLNLLSGNMKNKGCSLVTEWQPANTGLRAEWLPPQTL